MKRLLRLLGMFVPLIMFVTWVWVIFVKLERDVVVEVETLISEGKWEAAIQSVENVIQNNENIQMHLYVLGSVAKFGVEEELIKKGGKEPALNPAGDGEIKYRDYTYEMIQRDSTGLYLRESFFYRFKTFPRSKRFVSLLCDYLEYFPNAGEQAEEFQTSFRYALQPGIHWRNVRQSCLDHVFDSNWNFLEGIKLQAKTRSTKMTTMPKVNSKTIRWIKKKEAVLLRKKSDVSQKQKWLYVLDRRGRSGWVLSEYFL